MSEQEKIDQRLLDLLDDWRQEKQRLVAERKEAERTRDDAQAAAQRELSRRRELAQQLREAEARADVNLRAVQQAQRCTSPLNDLGARILEINRANGWDVARPEDWSGDAHKIAAALSLIHSEVSEALEALRENDVGNFSEELADTLIRVLDLSAGLGIDMDHVVHMKLELNKTRGYRHGGKRL